MHAFQSLPEIRLSHTARHCTYDNGTLVSATKVSDADATKREDAHQLRRVAAQAAARAKTAAMETSRLLMDIESAHKHASKLPGPLPAFGGDVTITGAK